MDVQSAPPTYTATGTGRPPMGNPPVLGQQVPGMTGGLPAQSGLSVTRNPMAQELQSYGRGEDTMLVHMTPNEVNSLQGLAMASGGSLTINPHTGLPEAGWLGRLLPSLVGLGLNFFLPGVGSAIGSALGGIGGAAGTGLLVGAGTAAITGNLQKGLMAGLGAYGGASLGGALKGAGAAAAGTAQQGAQQVAQQGAQQAAQQGAQQVAQQGAQQVAQQAAANAPVDLLAQVPGGINGVGQGVGTLTQTVLPGGGVSTVVGNAANTASPGLLSRFGAAASEGMGKGMIAKAAPMVAGLGLLNSVSGGSGYKQQDGRIDNSYEGPHYAQPRKVLPAVPVEDLLKSTAQRQYFDVAMPEVYNAKGDVTMAGSSTPTGTPIRRAEPIANAKKGQPMYRFVNDIYTRPEDRQSYAAGGDVFRMESGGHVFPAKAVAAYGNFNTEAGQRKLAALGGIPIRGAGDGVSDDIPAAIDGKTPARVANGEVYFPPKAVQRLGGNKRLYDMMARAEKAANKTKSGEKVKGLA